MKIFTTMFLGFLLIGCDTPGDPESVTLTQPTSDGYLSVDIETDSTPSVPMDGWNIWTDSPLPVEVEEEPECRTDVDCESYETCSNINYQGVWQCQGIPDAYQVQITFEGGPIPEGVQILVGSPGENFSLEEVEETRFALSYRLGSRWLGISYEDGEETVSVSVRIWRPAILPDGTTREDNLYEWSTTLEGGQVWSIATISKTGKVICPTTLPWYSGSYPACQPEIYTPNQ